MRRPFTNVLLTIALISAATTLHAGPWARGTGHFYGKLSYSDLRTEKLVLLDGVENDIPEFKLQQFLLYAELGLAEKLTLSVDVPLARRSEIAAFESASGVGDLRVGLQAQIAQTTDWHLAIREVVQAPTGDETKGSGLLPTGTGAWELESILTVGRSFDQGCGYGFVEFGYDLRGEGLHDGFLYEAQLGYSLTPRFSLHGYVRGLEPWDPAESIGLFGSAAGLGDSVTHMSVGGGVSVKLGGGLALEIEAEAMPRARNIAPGPTVRVGLSMLR